MKRYTELIKSLGDAFDLSVTELEGQNAGHGPLDSYHAYVRKRCEGCVKGIEGFVNKEMSSSELSTEQQLRVIQNEAVQQVAEQTAVCANYLLRLGRSVAEPLGLFDCDEDIEWPEDPLRVAAILRATVEAMARDVKELVETFAGETEKFSKGNQELKQPAQDFRAELDKSYTSAHDKLSEALRGMLWIIAASHFASN